MDENLTITLRRHVLHRLAPQRDVLVQLTAETPTRASSQH